MAEPSSRFRVIVVGFGNQGHKRARVAGSDLVATVDPQNSEADFRQIGDVAPDSYDAALICTPEAVKTGLIEELLTRGKHVMVEKPLLFETEADFPRLSDLARRQGVTCYTAYNHRFEPAIRKLKQVLDDGIIGTPYHGRLFYGNGTARDVRNSVWRDSGGGVLTDLGSHLLDLADFLFGWTTEAPFPVMRNRLENRAFDHYVFTLPGQVPLECEMSLLSWKNSFSIDVTGSAGSVHVSNLVKWGPSTITVRRRVLPSGRPDEESWSWVQSDPTWQLEYEYFKSLSSRGETTLDKDHRIGSALQALNGRTP